MKNVFKYYRIAFLTCSFILMSVYSSAQCAMCKAAVESSGADGGKEVATGINEAIVYLALPPYLIIMTIAFLIYWNRRKKKQEQEALNS